MGSGCGDSIVDQMTLRPPGNSPSRWHLTRRLLLCSRITIHDFTGNVNTNFITIAIHDLFLFRRDSFIKKLSYHSWASPAVFGGFPTIQAVQ